MDAREKTNNKQYACINQNNIEEFRELGYDVEVKPQKSIKDFLKEIGFCGMDKMDVKNVIFL